MIQDKIFFDEKDPTGLNYNTPFTVFGSYQGRLWSKTPSGSIKYYTQNSDLSVFATTGSNQFNGNQSVTGSLTVTGGITGSVTTSSYVEYTNVANKPTLVSGSSQVSYSGLTNIPSGILSGSSQVSQFGYAITGSNGFNGSQSITGSLTVTGNIIAQTLNVQQVTSSVVFSSGSNVFGNSLSNTQQFTGSVSISGSLGVVGNGTFSNGVTAANGNFNEFVKIDNQSLNNAKYLQFDANISAGANTSLGDIRWYNKQWDSSIKAQIVALTDTDITNGRLSFRTGTDSVNAIERWRITSTGILQSNGAQIVQSSSGVLTIQPTGGVNLATSSGNVGIGTTDTQTFKLSVDGPNVGQGDSSTTIRVFDTTSATTGTGGGISFAGYLSGTSSIINTFSYIKGGKENSTAGNFASYLSFGTRINGGGATERMRISSVGYIGINNNNPSYQLDLTGIDNAATSTFLRVFSNNRTVWTGIGYQRLETNGDLAIVAGSTQTFRAGGSDRMTITSSGNLKLNGTTLSAFTSNPSNVASGGTTTLVISQLAGQFQSTYLVTINGLYTSGGVNQNGYATAFINFFTDGSVAQSNATQLQGNGWVISVSSTTGGTFTITFTNSASTTMGNIAIRAIKLNMTGGD